MSKFEKGHLRDRMDDLVTKQKVKKQKAKEPEGDRSFVNTFPSKSSFAKAETVTMPKKELIEEHKRLVNVLESKSHKDDKKEAKKQKKELKEYTKKSKEDFVNQFKKSYDYRDLKVTVDSKDQQAAEETANISLVSYIKAGLENELNKIPLQDGELTLFKKGPGLYSGFYSDQYGQVVEKFDDQTVEMVAKNLELKELYLVQEPQPAQASSPVATLDQADSIAEAHVDHHNATMHHNDDAKKTHIKVRFGNFEMEIKKSIHGFINDFKKNNTTSNNDLKKAVKAWRRNSYTKTTSDLDAARMLLQEWDSHKEEFHQILYALKQGNNE